MELFSFRCFTFQSTLPARGATSADHMAQAPDCISIHAPRTGSDPWDCQSKRIYQPFQSTLPARGAT